MAQQDKTDWYWNGVLAGAVNNLYYDLINVDVCHVPYATNHRNSSFFLKTRLAYSISDAWSVAQTEWYEITDLKILWKESCSNSAWSVYAMWRNSSNEKAIFQALIREKSNWRICVENFRKITRKALPQWSECWDWKLFTTDFVKWEKRDVVEANERGEIIEDNNTSVTPVGRWATWIQINEYNLWTQIWLFTDENVKNWRYKFKRDWEAVQIWNYLLVYRSNNLDDSWFAWQVRMVTWFDAEWRIVVDAPWLWFKVPEEDMPQEWNWLWYAFFTDWWEVIGFSDNKDIKIFYWEPDEQQARDDYISVYNQWWLPWAARWKIIGVASTSSKIFVLTENWYIHYSKEWQWYNKFFIDDDMFAWPDKIALTAYRDMILAFWRKHIAIGVPDDQDTFWTMYDQSQTIWLRSRYSFAEYDWDLIFVSNDKRLLALWVSATAWRYMLQHEDVWDMLNWKLSALRPWDEVYLWSDGNNLRVFCNVSEEPYVWADWHANIRWNAIPSSTHIYKFDTIFKVWTEDHVTWHLIKWAGEGIYYWVDWIYVRDNAQLDCWDSEFETVINAYLIENESDWIWWSSSRLSNRPKLFNTAKLNRIITTLWPGIYSNNSKIKITSYSKWIWYTYEFPISGDWNEWIWLMTSYYLNEELSSEEVEKVQCLLSTIQNEDGQKQYQPNCSDKTAYRQFVAQNTPWCEDYDELLSESHWICINDKIYELAPTMPLVTSIWENQDYCTQIKLELIWWSGDIICFGWRLAEMFIAPLFNTGPDWEYQLQPETDCN